MRTILNNLQGLLEECLWESTKDREMLREIVQSTKESLTHNQHPSLLLAQTLNNSLIGYDGLDGCGSIDNTAEKSCFIEFRIQQPDGSFTKCRVLPPKDFISILGKAKGKVN